MTCLVLEYSGNYVDNSGLRQRRGLSTPGRHATSGRGSAVMDPQSVVCDSYDGSYDRVMIIDYNGLHFFAFRRRACILIGLLFLAFPPTSTTTLPALP